MLSRLISECYGHRAALSKDYSGHASGPLIARTYRADTWVWPLVSKSQLDARAGLCFLTSLPGLQFLLDAEVQET